VFIRLRRKNEERDFEVALAKRIFEKVYFILVGNSFQKRRRIGVWQRRSRSQKSNLSPDRMLKVKLPTFVKCIPLKNAT